MRNEGDLGRKRKKRRQESVGSVAANPDNLENSKEVGGKHKVPRAQVRTVQVEKVCPLLWCLIRGFRNEYNWSINASGIE